MKTYSWALNYLCVKRASTYAITMPNIGLYIRLMPMKLWEYVWKPDQTSGWLGAWDSLEHSPHCAGSPLMIYHLIDVTFVKRKTCSIPADGWMNQIYIYSNLIVTLFLSHFLLFSLYLQLRFGTLWVLWISVFSNLSTVTRPSSTSQSSSLCCTVEHGNVDTLCCWGDLFGFRVLCFGICRHWCTHLGLLR